METDEALYAKLVAGELAAFDRLYERYERSLFGFVRVQLDSDPDAEDVIHESFLAVLHARRAQTELHSFKAWLFQVARHLCLNRVRSRKRADRAIETAAREPVAPPEAEPDTAALHVAVGRLPGPLAEVYQLRAQGLSYDELAAILEVPLGTVKSRVHEMVKRLREEMNP